MTKARSLNPMSTAINLGESLILVKVKGKEIYVSVKNPPFKGSTAGNAIRLWADEDRIYKSAYYEWELEGWLPMPSEWRDINTAPKHKKILAGYYECGTWITVIAKHYSDLEWSDDWGDPVDSEQEFAPAGWYEVNAATGIVYPIRPQPTHWQPLPSPPKGDA